MSPVEAIRRRRVMHAVRDRAAANAALLSVGRDLRGRAAEELASGHPERAEPFLAEARVFEDAVQPLPAL